METHICVNVKPALIMLLGGIRQCYFSLKTNFNRLSKRCLSGRRTQRRLGLKEPVCVKECLAPNSFSTGEFRMKD